VYTPSGSGGSSSDDDAEDSGGSGGSGGGGGGDDDGDDDPTEPAPLPTSLPMIFRQTDASQTLRVGATSEALLLDAEEQGAVRFIILTEPHFLDPETLDFAPSVLEAYVDAVISHDFTGYVMLDWESNQMLTSLNRTPGSEAYEWAVSSLLEAYHYAKSLRPNAQWGFYGVPHMNWDFQKPDGGFWRWHEVTLEQRQARMDIATQARELLDTIDYWAPSIYDMWHDEDSPPIDAIGQQTYADNAIAHCVDEANGEKPVFALTWHRVLSSWWHQAQGFTENNANKLFSAEEWVRDQVAPAAAAGANGVVWWGHDIKMINNGYHMIIPWVRDELPYNGEVEHDMALVEEMHTERVEQLLSVMLDDE
ncbi:MAG: hypothetical protein HKN62_17690, partial [Phycisphaerales bacterium]|nr:hypothetical protein [Phycisphaerales bacterium]